MSRVERNHPHVPGHGIEGTLAALDFAKRLTTAHGRASGDDIARLRAAGFSEHEIGEIVSAVRTGHRGPGAPGR